MHVEGLRALSPGAAGPYHALSALSLVSVPGPGAVPPSPQSEAEIQRAWSTHLKELWVLDQATAS